MEQFQFKTEVSQLLELIIHSLYSHKEIFLRELVSNASDALDKLNYLTLTDEKYKGLSYTPRIDISFSEGDNPTLTISDSGIGMNQDDLVANLGTIANSGTKNFLKNLSSEAKKDSNLIGQFGVGFYACFMVASKVEVTSKKVGEDKAYLWTSEGKGSFTITEATRETQGTDIKLYLNEEGAEYASRYSLESLVKKYSDHIWAPIFLTYEDISYETPQEGKEAVKKSEIKTTQINDASALWRLSKNDLKDEDYNNFYKGISYDVNDPLLTIHTKAEGTLEYTTLFYIPEVAPIDMYYADYKPGVKLYVKRVFITDDNKELMPAYLRFLRGVIDSEDLPLNVSREILQQNRVMSNIRNASVKKVLSEIKKLSQTNPDRFEKFIAQYNRPMKEGLVSDYANKEDILSIIRFKSSEVEGYTSLAAYKERMKSDQKTIYYITGGKEDSLRNSPLLNGYKKRGIEVLLCDDEIDDFVIPSIGKFEDIELKAVNRSDSANEFKSDEDKKKEEDNAPIAQKLKEKLEGRVKEVRISTNLGDAPSAVIADENDPTAQMQQMLKAMGQTQLPQVLPILQINPDHNLISLIKEDGCDDGLVSDVATVLLDQALLIESSSLQNPVPFVLALNRLISKVQE